MTLDDLPAAFTAAREAASLAARWSTSSCPPDTCRYCGKFWRRHPLTKIDGHTLCVVTPEFIAELNKLWWSSPGLARERIAELLGLSKTTVYGWTNPWRMERAA